MTLPLPVASSWPPIPTTIVGGVGGYAAEGVRVGADDRTLVMIAAGTTPAYPAGSACWERYLPRATWLDGVVHLSLTRVMNAEPDLALRYGCFEPGLHTLTVTLDRSLAGAAIVSGSLPVPVFHERDLLVPSWLPDGWALTAERPDHDPLASWTLVFERTDRPPHVLEAQDDPERARIDVTSYAYDVSGILPRDGVEDIVVRGLPGRFSRSAGDPGTRQPPGAAVTWEEAGRTRTVAFSGDGLVADVRALCLSIAEQLASAA